MPSRKRNKGKARKEKVKEKKRGIFPISTNLRSECSHGVPENAPNSCIDFIIDYSKLLKTQKDDVSNDFIFSAIEATYQKYIHVAFNVRFMKTTKVILVSMAIDGILDGDFTDAQINMHARSVMALESVFLGKDAVAYARIKIEKIRRGGNCAAVRYLSKNTPCGCIMQFFANLEPESRTKFCTYCQKDVVASEILRCSGCRIAEYCSLECQKVSWRKHKKECEKLAAVKKNAFSWKSVTCNACTGRYENSCTKQCCS